MKGEGSDDALNKVLSEWRLNAPLPPRFQELVWRRIETAEAPHVTLWNLAAQWVGIVLPRPAMAVSYVAILLALGISVGWVQARQQTAQVKSQLGQRYMLRHFLEVSRTMPAEEGRRYLAWVQKRMFLSGNEMMHDQ